MSPTVTPTLDKANTEQLAQGHGVFGRAADRADPCLRLSAGLVHRVHTGGLPRRLSALSLIPSSMSGTRRPAESPPAGQTGWLRCMPSTLSLIPSSIRRIIAKSPNSMSTTPSRAIAGLVQS